MLKKNKPKLHELTYESCRSTLKMNEVKLLYNYNENDLVFYGSKSDGSNFVLSSRVCARIAVGARGTIWICQRRGAGAWHWVCAQGTVWVCGADGNMMIGARGIVGARGPDGIGQPLGAGIDYRWGDRGACSLVTWRCRDHGADRGARRWEACRDATGRVQGVMGR